MVGKSRERSLFATAGDFWLAGSNVPEVTKGVNSHASVVQNRGVDRLSDNLRHKSDGKEASPDAH